MGVPIHYQIQVNHYMAVTGATHCYVAALIGNEELIIHRIDRDEEIIDEIMKLERFGKKSVEKLLNAIEKSKNTTLDRFIYSLSIPLIGKSASKTISKYFNGSFDSFYQTISENPFFDWTQFEDFGSSMNENLDNYFSEYHEKVNELANMMTFDIPQTTIVIDNPFNNKTICVTGKLNNFTRDSINEKIVSLGAKVTSSVTKKTDYLITNEASNSSKYQKAMELDIKVISEEEFLNMLNQ